MLTKLLGSVKRAIAVAALFVIYEFAWLVARARSIQKPTKRKLSGRILLIGTFDNANWFHAHVEPIVRSGHSDVVMVCDQPIAGVEGVTFCCPPAWANSLLPRAAAKFIWSIIAMRRHQPDLCMGYHIFPAGVIALIIGSTFGRPTAFQVTSGQLELEGGGWHAENRVLIALGHASRIVERSVLRVLREFDLVIVRGSQAKSYVERAGYQNELITITGSVDMPDSRRSFSDRSFDIVFVGRLTEYKRPDRFLDVITELARSCPNIRAVVLGDGPDGPDLIMETERRGLTKNIVWNGKTSNVEEVLAISRVHLLTSRWEGVSIAMLESMGAGCVPVVSNVGDLGDFVVDGVSGYILPEDAIGEFAKRISDLLADPDLWEQLSSRSRHEIESRASMTAIAEFWNQALNATLDSD